LRLERAAELETHIHPHSFRHYLALAARRAGKEADAVCNSMGWADAQQYNSRYGKRTAFETLGEMRDLVEKRPPAQKAQPEARQGPQDIIDLRPITRPKSGL